MFDAGKFGFEVGWREAMDIPERTARFHLKSFGDLGLLRARGAGRARRYELVLP